MKKSIEIDCAPGDPRPDSYLKLVLKGTGIKVKEPVSKLFGNWEWDYSEVPNKEWEKVRPILRERIVQLHSTGHIRYGSW